MRYFATVTQPGVAYRRRVATGLLSAVLALALASCSSGDGGLYGGGGGASGDGGDGGGAQEISFTAPTADAEVTSPVAFTLDSGGEAIGEPETGNRHFHVYVDDASEYEIVYSAEGQVEVPEGEHTLRAVLAEPNHDETDVATEVTVNVTGGGAPAPAEEDEESGRPGY